MIEFVTGDMFEKKADIRINTVNCVGAMGAGVALAFKKKFPVMFKEYNEECKKGNVRPGKPHVWTDYRIDGNLTIVNLPTKDHWKKPSEYSYIKSGLKWFRDYLKEKEQVTVTIPALGCGHGGLEWDKVKKLIVEYLGGLDAQIYVFEPADTHRLNEFVENETKNELHEKGIITISPSDPSYPQYLKGKSTSSIYAKGAFSVVNERRLTILPSRKMEAREKEAVLLCLDYLVQYNLTYILGYTAGDCFILNNILEKRGKAIVCLEEGILQFSIKKELATYWDDSLVTVVSILKPNQKWAKHTLKSSLDLKISLGNTALITAYDPLWLSKTHEETQKMLRDCFYVNYGSLSSPLTNFFTKIKAAPVSKDLDGIPKLQELSNKAFHLSPRTSAA